MPLTLLLIAILSSLLLHTPADAVTSASYPPPRYREGELIVKFRNETSAVNSLIAAKTTTLRKLQHTGARHIRLPAGTTVAKALEQYRKDPNVMYAEPNYRVHKASTPNDTYFNNQWALVQIAASTAWQGYTWPNPSSNSVIVAVLDTGVAYNHPDLQANLWTNPDEIPGNGIDDDNNGIIDDYYGANYLNASSTVTGDPMDDDLADSHGTHLAGIIGAVGNNGIGISGLNWAARIMAIKFLHGNDGNGDLSDALEGVNYAIAKGARIINMSFEVEGVSSALSDALSAADRAGVLVVSAAGNGDDNGTPVNLNTVAIYPAGIRSANNITVAASTASDGLASYSNYGDQTVHLAAPGGDYDGVYLPQLGHANAILSTVWLAGGNTQYRTTAGTSMAAPHVAGAAALIWNRFPGLSHYQIKDRIIQSVDLLPAFADTTISGGRLNLARALNDLVLSASTTSGTAPLTVTFTATPADQYTTWEWDLGSGSYAHISGVSNSLSHTFQTAGSYLIRVRADGSEATATITVTTPPPSSSGGGGGCFIATAAWGSPLHPKVALLRAFRDQHLLTNLPGRMFVKAYYTISPPVADFIARHENLRTATRFLLNPLVLLVEYQKIFGQILLLCIALLLFRKLQRNVLTHKKT